MRNAYFLTCPALAASLQTDCAATASRWLVDVMATCPVGATVDVLVNGINCGARVAARLMSLSEATVERAILAETEAINATPRTLFPIAA